MISTRRLALQLFFIAFIFIGMFLNEIQGIAPVGLVFFLGFMSGVTSFFLAKIWEKNR